MIIILIIISKKAKCSPNTRSMRIKLWFPRTVIVKKCEKLDRKSNASLFVSLL